MPIYLAKFLAMKTFQEMHNVHYCYYDISFPSGRSITSIKPFCEIYKLIKRNIIFYIASIPCPLPNISYFNRLKRPVRINHINGLDSYRCPITGPKQMRHVNSTLGMQARVLLQMRPIKKKEA